MSKRDYYEVLGIDKTATEREIKRAYRKKAKEYHPDLNPDNKDAEEKFQEATEAYEVLSNEEKRARYDQFGHAGVDSSGFGQGFGGFEDIFGDIFDIFGGGRRSSRSNMNRPTRGNDIRYDIELDFEEAVFGVEKEIQLRRVENCHVCEGDGAKPGSKKVECKNCKGTGEVQHMSQTPFGQFVSTETCNVCSGTGQQIENPCENCQGSGKEVRSRRIKVKIPAGVDNGSIISMSGEGEAGNNGGPSGDLYIYISVREDDIFKRYGNDVFLNLPITYSQAALGAEIEVPTLEGITKFKIPSGTQIGQEFKLKEKGIKDVRGRGRGDLYFKVEVKVPKKLNSEQRELLEKLDESLKDTSHKERKTFFEKIKDVFKDKK